MNNINKKILERIKSKLGDQIQDVNDFRDELTIRVGKEHIVDICKFLKEDEDLCFDFLADLFGIDMNTAQDRFGVIYNLYSLKNKFRIRLKTYTQENDPKVPSVTGIWKTANWHEREVFDMFGIIFEGHPDLRRIYMPEDFQYYPLRKEFPLMGIPGSIELPKK